jgi:hypothetical protein
MEKQMQHCGVFHFKEIEIKTLKKALKIISSSNLILKFDFTTLDLK